MPSSPWYQSRYTDYAAHGKQGPLPLSSPILSQQWIRTPCAVPRRYAPHRPHSAHGTRYTVHGTFELPHVVFGLWYLNPKCSG